jgi:hypothetical protein
MYQIVKKNPSKYCDLDTEIHRERLYQFSLVSNLLSALIPRAAPVRKCHLVNNFLPQDAPGTVAWSSCSKD